MSDTSMQRHANREIVLMLRDAAADVTGGNCAFADDDLAILTHLEAYDFLMGEGPLDGVWFGDIHKGLAGAFWWRGLLKAAAGWPEPPAMRAAAPLVEKATASPPAGI